MVKDEFFTLSNGITIPRLGFGTWQAKDGDEAYNAVKWALEAGYRHIDTAYVYGNERSVAKAIRDSGVAREEIFLTTKLPAEVKEYDPALEYFERSLRNLDTDYLDLYLIHAPWPWSNVGQDCTEGNIAAWRAMIKLYNEKRIRSIGVSNFHPGDIDNIVNATGVVPQVNQIRFFIGNTQEQIVDYCRKNDILVEAYSPMATGNILKNRKLMEIAEKYKVSISRLCIRYCIERDTLPLPKSVHEQWIYENLDVDFTIGQEDMDYLNSLVNEELKKPLRS